MNLTKNICKKPISNIIHNGKKLKYSLLILETRQWCYLSVFLFNIILEILGNEIGQEKDKRYTAWGGRNKTVFVYR